MTTIDHETLIAQLDRLKLTAIRDQLDTLLDEAARSKMNLREALAFLVTREIARRDERRIKAAGFPAVKSIDSFDFKAIPSLNKMLVLELARCDYVNRSENVIAVGNSGAGSYCSPRYVIETE